VDPSDPLDPARWFHIEGDQRRGPVALDAMRQLVAEGAVTSDTLVWADGMPDWTPARKVPAVVPPSPLRERLGWPAAEDASERVAHW